MADEPITLAVLAKSHREMIAPEFARLANRLDHIDRTLEQFHGRFAAIFQRFERLENLAASRAFRSGHAESPAPGEPRSMGPMASA